MTTKNHRLLFISILILSAAFSRLIPHPANFTAIGAMALFAGARMRFGAGGLVIPMVALLLSDVIIGFHTTMWGVYVGFVLVWLIGNIWLKEGGFRKIAIASIGGSTLFFLVSNFAVWMQGTYYPLSLEGLAACYAAAIPFYSNDIFGSFALNSVMGDLFFNGVLFGALSLYSRFALKPSAAH
jgi:hypothetical protein